MSHQTQVLKRSSQLLDVLAGYDQLFIVMHDNPDPDAIATGWAVHTLIEEKLGTPTRLIGGGAIVRAENLHMVDLLGPPIQLVFSVEVPDNCAAVLVDCALGASNQLLTRSATKPVAVIDHHQSDCRDVDVAFADVRPDVAASATIAADYLREQHIEPGPKLATALVYAMRTETRGCETHHSELDNSVLVWLTERAEPALLAEIENAPLSRRYFADLAAAMSETVVYDDTAFCMLPHAAGPEIVGEVADLLIRCHGIHRALCAAVVDDDLLLSARTQRDSENACHLLQRTLDGIGGGGGHAHRAGGKIPRVNGDRRRVDKLHKEVRQRWLAACDAAAETAQPLVLPSL
jgi:nanoRNase/pAp phosphatase (c-di-AMP/oligoRNAs hydrolase)